MCTYALGSPADDDAPISPLGVRALTTPQEHTDLLKHVLASAQKTVTITSFCVDAHPLVTQGLGEAIIAATSRGVQVYIYYDNKPYFLGEAYGIWAHLEECCARLGAISTHAKCVVRDDDLVAVGSYNWLGPPFEGGSNASFLMEGAHTSALKQDILQCIRFYQSRKHANKRGQKSFLQNTGVFSAKAYPLGGGASFYTLTTPEAHHKTLHDVFEGARERIVLVSPFVRLKQLQSLLGEEHINELEERCVSTTLICLPSPCSHTEEEKEPIFAYLERLSETYPHFSFETREGVHTKALVADNDFICVGSLNWLSAAADISQPFHKFEMSVALKGVAAKPLIAVLDLDASRQDAPLAVPAEDDAPVAQTSTYVARAPAPHTSMDCVYRIFSGERFRKPGFCARLTGGDYIKDDQGKVIYFPTQDEAKNAAMSLYIGLFDTGACADDFAS
ncbi:MAG: phospholipase D-like domain-containing protein [Proteobacteria bacterium]|nr:phospholipase D-like domain-containing protein [Pseudomonadota bacterium]